MTKWDESTDSAVCQLITLIALQNVQTWWKQLMNLAQSLRILSIDAYELCFLEAIVMLKQGKHSHLLLKFEGHLIHCNASEPNSYFQNAKSMLSHRLGHYKIELNCPWPTMPPVMAVRVQPGSARCFWPCPLSSPSLLKWWRRCSSKESLEMWTWRQCLLPCRWPCDLGWWDWRDPIGGLSYDLIKWKSCWSPLTELWGYLNIKWLSWILMNWNDLIDNWIKWVENTSLIIWCLGEGGQEGVFITAKYLPEAVCIHNRLWNALWLEPSDCIENGDFFKNRCHKAAYIMISSL